VLIKSRWSPVLLVILDYSERKPVHRNIQHVRLIFWCVRFVEQGRFSTKSDVWSFGVTVWELLTLAGRRPYDWLDDDQLMSTLRHWHSEHPASEPPPPAAAGVDCPRELDDLMRQCWSRDEAQRPTFADISVFLTVKSAGFCPPSIAWPH